MTSDSSAAQVDRSHSGLQRLFFVCISKAQRPIAELERRLDDHKAYLGALEQEGRLFAAGPLLTDGKYDGTGMLVFNVASREEAEAIAKADPFHREGLRSFSLQPWQVNEGSLAVRLTFSTSGVTFL